MTPARAKEVLEGIADIQGKSLASLGKIYRKKNGQITKIIVDGIFTPDQLEAIAAWMRDPKGVCEA